MEKFTGTPEEIERKLKQEQAKVDGEHLDGKLTPDDQGSLMMAIASVEGKVVVRFPKPVGWFALAPDQAVELAQLLIQRALQAGYDKPVTITIE